MYKVSYRVLIVSYSLMVDNIRSKETCDGIGNNRPDLGPTCGRPLGIGFHLRTKQLFVADAYQGFVVIAPNQTVATKIAGGADGVPFKLPTGLDVDQSTGNVYFTDASSQYSLRYNIRHLQQIFIIYGSSLLGQGKKF